MFILNSVFSNCNADCKNIEIWNTLTGIGVLVLVFTVHNRNSKPLTSKSDSII